MSDSNTNCLLLWMALLVVIITSWFVDSRQDAEIAKFKAFQAELNRRLVEFGESPIEVQPAK